MKKISYRDGKKRTIFKVGNCFYRPDIGVAVKLVKILDKDKINYEIVVSSWETRYRVGEVFSIRIRELYEDVCCHPAWISVPQSFITEHAKNWELL